MLVHNLVRRLRARVRTVHRPDSGQSAILMAAILFMFAVFGFATIDVGLAFGARRDAQSDADLIALAGAIELPNFDNDAAAGAAAQSAAETWAAANDVDLSQLTVNVIRSCFSADDGFYTGVHVRVERTPPGFFFGIFPGAPRLDVAAEATACSGTPQEMTGYVPFAVDTIGGCFTNEPNPSDRVPIYGERCDLVVGGLFGESGDVGQLGISTDPTAACEDGNGSAAVYESNIINGSASSCAVGDSVTSNTGINVGKTKSGLEARLALEGACDTAAAPGAASDTTTFNAHPVIPDLVMPLQPAVDDLFEIWRPGLGYDANDPGNHLEQYDCDPSTTDVETSPRNVVVIIVTDIAIDDGSGCTGGGGPSPHCYIVLGFARVYIEGCTTTQSGFDAMCAQSGGGSTFTIHARFVDAVGGNNNNGSLGVSQFGDIQTVLRD